MVLNQLSSKIPNKASSFFTEFNSRSITRLSGFGMVRSGTGSGTRTSLEAHALSDSEISSKAVIFSKAFIEVPIGLGREEVDLVLILEIALVQCRQTLIVLVLKQDLLGLVL